MPRVLRTPLILLALLAAVVVGAKALMYFNAKSTIDRFIAESATEVNITYEDIVTEFSGAVAVTGIHVRPWDVEQGVTIDMIRLDTGDPWYFIKGEQWVPGETAPPASMSVSLSGLVLDLKAEWLQDMRPPASAAAPKADACAQGLSTDLDPDLLAELGFEQLTIDTAFSYNIDDDTERLDASISFSVQDIQTTEGDVEIAGISTKELDAQAVGSIKLVEFATRMRIEPEFGQRAARLCAARRNQSVEEYAAFLMQQAVNNAALGGIELGPGLKDALGAFYTDWGSLELSARPAEPMGLLSLVFLPPEQLATTLGIRLSVNNQAVNDTSFRWLRPDQRDAFAQLIQPSELSNLPRPDIAEYRRYRIERNYLEVPPADLAAHVNADVRIVQQGQPERSGRLVAVRNGEAAVQQRLHGGKITAHIPLAQIARAEVLIVKKVEISKPGD